MVHKGKEIEHLTSCTVILMKYILKYEHMTNLQGYIDERIEDEGMNLF